MSLNPAVFKKKKPETKAVQIDKYMDKQALEEMQPKEKLETSEEKETYASKEEEGMGKMKHGGVENNIEIELMLQAAKKKKK